MIEEIVFGSIKTHDLELCKDLILKSKVLKEGDILINDRGFISREIINKLKKERKVDVYVPAKKNMDIYKQAVEIAKGEGKWHKHPTKSRKEQEIQLIKDVGMFWQSDKPNEDVKINACVVYDKKKKEYFVFLTTDTKKTAKQIIKTYELRPEIEEDYRQIKEFWKLEDFKSTKYNFILFHIVMLLIGYMYFQIYKNTEEGQKYAKKSLPVAIKKYVCKKEKKVIIYRGRYFAIFNFLEFIKLYSSCSEEIQSLLDPILALV
ncbi:transposase [Caloranaerobacter azorensis]|uniref:Transposase n=1 Tax=Caloranaerobacter azorensis TaxID=116090 RepID=A0A6P1YH61_9FIRM|nr:transposase [Caloranaerobacter azorensis]QIB28123.1 transposase [Caloranaerobacter azorensis]QIB28132.1 transposase [Caloranaerobacter azorensis]QIB28162.1 transposase [Caloranaerobacter azorensis]QIB28167.1 transposase [Caloranaerobacter azorensis]